MSALPNLFQQPVPWNIVPGPPVLQSIDEAINAVQLWFAVRPRTRQNRAERERMLALQDILRRAQEEPSEAELESASLAIEGMVRFARIREQCSEARRRRAAQRLIAPAVIDEAPRAAALRPRRRRPKQGAAYPVQRVGMP